MDGDLLASVAQYSMGMSALRTQQASQTALMKSVMSLQEDMMSQLLATMGVGGSLNITA